MIADFADANLLRSVLLSLAAALAVVGDVRTRRIPNALTLPVAAAGLLLGAASGGGRGLALAVAGLVTGALLFVVPVARFGWGMGDLKLAAALGAVGGPLFALWMGLYALAAGGVFGLLWLLGTRRLGHVVGGMREARGAGQPLACGGLAIPFAVPIAAGVALALLVSPGLPR